MVCIRFRLGALLAMLITSAVSIQQVFEAEQEDQASSFKTDPLVSLETKWQVLGPFPAGMRELPFGGFPPSVCASYAELLDPGSASSRYSSAYGPNNGTTSPQSFDAQVQAQSPERIQQTLSVEYPNVDWSWTRKSAGWSSLQWQVVAATDLEIGRNNTALAITLDKTAEFAVVPKADFSTKDPMRPESGSTKAIEWHTGDWYSYISAFSREDDRGATLPISQHLLCLDNGAYKLVVRAMYEIRIFGDPHNNGGEESPKITFGIDVAARSLQDQLIESLLQVHTDPHHSNVPHVVGGWVAGWGLSFAIRNLHPNDTYILQGVDVFGSPFNAASPPIAAELGLTMSVAPGQTILVPVELNQSIPLDADATYLDLSLRLKSATDPAQTPIAKSVHIPLIHRPAFWDASSSNQDHNAYMYSYLAPDHTVQLAAATPPKRTGRTAIHTEPRPPLILTLHGAGVDVRDLFFSNSIQRQNDSWSVLPTGRTPWGYDWQLASLEAADAAVTALHKHLYGLPANMSEEERQKWQFDPEKLFIMGHSNGGQGAWYRLSHFPDRVIGGVVASAYTKVSDYVSFAWKVGRHFVDPALQGILHSGVTMFENDLFASNLVGLDLLVKYGSADANVPPWNSKDMSMVVNGWNRRSGLLDKVKIAEVPGRPHWWDTLFTEDDVQDAIEAACVSSRNPGYSMPDTPPSFTLTVFNPDEAGSKAGWRISEVEVPGRLARLEVRYKPPRYEKAVESSEAQFEVVAKNAKRFELDAAVLRHSSYAKTALANVTAFRVAVNGQEKLAEIGASRKVRFVHRGKGQWELESDEHVSPDSAEARPIGPLLRIVSTEGPMVLVVPSVGPTAPAERKAWGRAARRFAADLILYGAINSQIVTDADFVSVGAGACCRHSNIVSFGGPEVNLFTRSVYANWPTESPIRFPSPVTSPQFEIQGRSFYETGTAMLALAPHPTYARGLTLIAHGIGVQGVARAARLLPTRTATMLPEWIVVDPTTEWMGEGGVQAAGWYDRDWAWSESMSYVQ